MSPHFQEHASDNWEPEGAGSDGVVNRSWSGRRSNMLSGSTCRIAAEDIGRMPAETSTARGRCLIGALIVWITPDRPLGPGLNRFQGPGIG